MRLPARFRWISLAATVAATAACRGDVNNPPLITNFDARHALAEIEPLAVVLNQPIFTSFNGALSSFETYFRSTPVGASTVVPSVGALDLRLARTLAPVAELRASAIPDDVKGKTFVWSADTRAYVPDATATGAPINGVRFVLYTWDILNGPTLPLNRIGHIDIAPAEDEVAGQERTELSVFREAPFLPVADFVVMHSTMAGVSNFGIQGSATDGFTVDLVDLSGTSGGASGQRHLVYNTSLSSSPPGVSATEQLGFDQATGAESGHLELAYEGHKLTDERVGPGTEIRFDGSLYARVIFPASIDDQTQYLKPDGTSLSQQEVADLNAVLDRAIVANFFWISLAWP